MERFVIRCGNFELFGSKLDRIAYDLDAIKKAAIEKAVSDDCEEIAEFDNEEAALNELKNYKSDIRDANFCIGRGYTGSVYWCDREWGEDFINLETIEYSDFESNPFETDDNDKEDED